MQKPLKHAPWAGLFLTLEADLAHPFKSLASTSPSSGVLNQNSRVWGFQNLHVKYYVQLDFSRRVYNLQYVSRGLWDPGGLKNRCPGVGPCREGPVLIWGFTKVSRTAEMRGKAPGAGEMARATAGTRGQQADELGWSRTRA